MSRAIAVTLILPLAGAALAAGEASTPASAAPPAAAGARTYDFLALLDGKPIGRHRFEVGGDPKARTVASEAEFSVRVLGFQAYHYHHHADEQWQGDCLAELSSTTDDDGKPASVHAERDGDVDEITTTKERHDTTGCLMSYAYWNPLLRTQTRLLNPQTGKVDAVRVARVGTGTVDVGGKPVPATRYRIEGPEAPVDVWYSAQGDWIGLDSVVDGKRRLSYRLR